MAPTPDGPPTMAQVAREARVSTMTVSNAFNRPEEVSAATLRRVLGAARHLGYAGPNAAGRALRKGRWGVLGLVVADDAFRAPAPVEFLRGMAAEAAAHHSAVQLLAPSAVATSGVDAVVVLALPTGAGALADAARRRIPAVSAGGAPEHGLIAVGIDIPSAADEVAAHVLSGGHRSLVALTGPLRPGGAEGRVDARSLRSAPAGPATRFVAGVRRAVERSGGRGTAVTVWQAADLGRASGRRAASALLRSPRRPSALLCAGDGLALGVLDRANELGLAVPDELTVTGFDDVEEAAWAHPPLTTVRQRWEGQGRSAARAALGLTSPGRPRPVPTRHHQLVIRASSGARPVAGRSRP